jgi:hypothetical protein
MNKPTISTRPTYEEDHNVVYVLINKQIQECPNILYELNNNGKKKTHWAWYIFPTNKPGFSDPLQTYVTIHTAQILLKFAPQEWRLCLEKIIDLAIYNNNVLENVLPDEDIGRVRFFVKFWNSILNKDKWLTNVCEDLNNILTGRKPFQRRQISTSIVPVQRHQIPVQRHQISTNTSIKPVVSISKWFIQSDKANEWFPAQPWQDLMITNTIESKKNYYANHEQGGTINTYVCTHNSPGNIILWNLTTKKQRIVIHSEHRRPNHNGAPPPFGGMAVDLLSLVDTKNIKLLTI